MASKDEPAGGTSSPLREIERFQVRTGAVDLGRCLPPDVDNVADVLAAGEGASFR